MPIDLPALVATVASTGATDPERAAILDAARALVEAALGKRIRFLVQDLRAEGEWRFLRAEMQDLHGRPISYAGTPRAEAARAGFVSTAFAALLRREGKGWTVVEQAIGPTDVAWLDWPARHGVSRALVGE